jgi:hypothetical protein
VDPDEVSMQHRRSRLSEALWGHIRYIDPDQIHQYRRPGSVAAPTIRPGTTRDASGIPVDPEILVQPGRGVHRLGHPPLATKHQRGELRLRPIPALDSLRYLQ